MRRPLLLVALSCTALAGGVSAHAADSPPQSPSDPPPPLVIAEAVTIGGLDVGGLTRAEAAAAVQAWFARPIVLKLEDKRARALPGRDLRARALKWRAVDNAMVAPSGTALLLRVELSRRGLRRYAARIADRFDRAPRNSVLSLRHLRPHVTKAKWGRRVETWQLRTSFRMALRTHARGPFPIPREGVRPSVNRGSFGPTIVIRRDSKRLLLYRGVRPKGAMKWRATFGVATGQPQYPTPTGRFSIVTMQRNPWWYPPDSGWAAGADPIPPGPGNPLGTRWMGLSVSSVGIHGTPDAASIGYSASHGCIRMRIPDAERVFERVRIGSTVFIVSA
jgi:lipoprotein-anchoring transpeptidase ErfK/SrfK